MGFFFFHFREACKRVANQVSAAETSDKIDKYRSVFFEELIENRFAPGGRIWYNSGRPHPQLLNCFVLENEIDSKEGWANIASETIVTSMSGGGCGISFSDIRPEGASISGHRGIAPGPIWAMRMINGIGSAVKAAGGRRAAFLFGLSLTHPDIVKFIDIKLNNKSRTTISLSDFIKNYKDMTTEEVKKYVDDRVNDTHKELENANISVVSLNTLDLIEAINKGGSIELSWKGKYKSNVSARDIWDKITKNALECADPGLLNAELANSENTIFYEEELGITNPCLTGDMRIETIDGPKNIRDMVGSCVLKNAHGDFVEATVWSNGVKPIVGIVRSRLPLIKCTPDHRWMNSDGDTVLAEDLIGHRIMPFDDSSANDIVTDIIDLQDEEVFDFNLMGDLHWGIVEGLFTHNCGEIWLSPHESCCLGHLVLPRFAKEDGINWEMLGTSTRHGIRFLDNVLTVNHYPLEKMKQKSHRLRRIGLGTTGLADLLAILGYRYGSDDGNKFVDKLFRFISKQAYEESVLLAVEKGPFPACKPDLHIKSGYVKRMTPKIKSLISEHGIRNCAMLTQAPVGTMSIVCGNLASGIEPMFAYAYWRTYFDGDNRVKELCFHPLFIEFLEKGKNVEHFISSHALTPRDHLEVQKIVQKHLDNACSKTVNLPHDYTVEELSKVWLEYLPFLKGTTFYREGSISFTDKDGNIIGAPLVPLSMEEAIRLYKEQKTVVSKAEQVNDCPKGVCEL